ncbi:hypothetical protein [Vineibacter terrae]|nr:hypothetical protein [Vineibacter terrae]
MPRMVIAMLVAGTLGLGFAAQASAEGWGKDRCCIETRNGPSCQ